MARAGVDCLADVGVKGDRIVRIGKMPEGQAIST